MTAWYADSCSTRSVAGGAQQPPSITSGPRVRVWTAPSAEPVTGKVLGVDATTMTLSIEGAVSPPVVTRSTITRLDVGHRRSTGRTVLYATLIGVATGMAVGLASGDDPPGFPSFSAGEKALLYSVLMAPAGAVTGLLVGPGPERWTTALASPARAQGLAALPAPSLRLRLRF